VALGLISSKGLNSIAGKAQRIVALRRPYNE
jgi:hypothetical protein